MKTTVGYVGLRAKAQGNEAWALCDHFKSLSPVTLAPGRAGRKCRIVDTSSLRVGGFKVAGFRGTLIWASKELRCGGKAIGDLCVAFSQPLHLIEMKVVLMITNIGDTSNGKSHPATLRSVRCLRA